MFVDGAVYRRFGGIRRSVKPAPILNTFLVPNSYLLKAIHS
jgi:hypothetical protein